MNGGRAFFAMAIALVGGLWCAAAAAQDDTVTLKPPPAPESGDQVIHLHMPAHHAARHNSKAQTSAPASVDEIHAVPPESTTKIVPPAALATPTGGMPAKGRARAATTKKAPAIPFSFGDAGEESPASTSPVAPPVRTAEIPSSATKAHAASPLGAANDHAGLARRGSVLFQKGNSDPSPAQYKGVKLLAADLSAALESGATRVQLEAYGGAPGDKSSDARRLSLKRALAVRQLLIDNGVPSSRIDVRAMGGVDDKGPSDRVDVFIRTG